jgi:hypothetical protein
MEWRPLLLRLIGRPTLQKSLIDDRTKIGRVHVSHGPAGNVGSRERGLIPSMTAMDRDWTLASAVDHHGW